MKFRFKNKDIEILDCYAPILTLHIGMCRKYDEPFLLVDILDELDIIYGETFVKSYLEYLNNEVFTFGK